MFKCIFALCFVFLRAKLIFYLEFMCTNQTNLIVQARCRQRQGSQCSATTFSDRQLTTFLMLEYSSDTHFCIFWPNSTTL